MNIELLKQLYCIHSPSMKEKKLRKFITSWCRLNVPNAAVKNIDGNIFITRGESKSYPCVAAHLDQVQNLHSNDFTVIESGGVLFGFSPSNKRPEGLGADDKNGVFIALECLKKYDTIKIALFRGEEIGCIGSSECNLNFFNDVRYVIQCDRRGGCDIITSSYDGLICSDEFIKAADPELFGYYETEGLLTDVIMLASRGVGVSCVNLSCGYYNPHTNNECTVISELENCYNFVCQIIENCTDTYLFDALSDNNYLWPDDKYLTIDTNLYNLILDNPRATFDEIYNSYSDILGDRDLAAARYKALTKDFFNKFYY